MATVATTQLQPNRLRAELALAFCTLLWGSTFVVVKNSLYHSSVFVFLAQRFSLAGLCMAAFRPQVFRVLRRDEIFAGVRLGFFMFCGYAFQTAGLRYTTASNSGFITGSSVVLVPLILALFWGKRVTLWVSFGTLAAAAGLYFLTVPVTGVAHLNRGDVLTFFAATSYAVHIILVGEYAREHSAAALSVLQVLACAVLAWLTALGADAIRWQPMRFHSTSHLWNRCAQSCRENATAVANAAQTAMPIHDAKSRRDYFYVGAGVCGGYFLRCVGREAWPALDCRGWSGAGGDSCGGIAGAARGAGVA
jgi:drug/metabolite transporter (DMT)-like permease